MLDEQTVSIWGALARNSPRIPASPFHVTVWQVLQIWRAKRVGEFHQVKIHARVSRLVPFTKRLNLADRNLAFVNHGTGRP